MISASGCTRTRRRNRLRGAGRRRARPHAVHRQDHQAVRARPRSSELCRGDPARLQPVRPPRQYLQGAHQDPGPRTRHREIRSGSRGRMAADATTARWRSTMRRSRTSVRASPIRLTKNLPHMPDELKKAAHDPHFEAWRKNSVVAAQGAGLCDRDAVAEAGRRTARRRHRRPDGCDRRSRRQIFLRRNPRRPRAESGAAPCRQARPAGAVEGARQDRRRDAERQSGLRHHRLPGAGLLLARQRALDPDRAGIDPALRQSRHRQPDRAAAHQHLRLHQCLRPSSRRPYRHSRRREERRGILSDHDRRPRRRECRARQR